MVASKVFLLSLRAMLKRLAVWLVEIAAGAFLMDMFYILWFGPSGHGLAADFLAAFGATVGLFMVSTGYPLTTAVLRLAWRNPTRLWLYSSASALLIIVHLQFFIAFVAGGWDLSMRLVIQAGAACAAFVCTFAGGWFLRKWLQPGAVRSGAAAEQSKNSERQVVS
jgi:hypothetical protein